MSTSASSHMPGWGTAAAASVFLALTLPSNATTVRVRANPPEQEVRSAKRQNSQWLSVDAGAPETAPLQSYSALHFYDLVTDVERATTSREKLIGELRRLALLKENWDTEGAAAPDARSLEASIAFARLLSVSSPTPESMLLHSGHAGLFWHNETVYADLEFLGDGRIAYFIERQGDKHKGVAKFDLDKMPVVFPALLEI